jgi:hypothetical protein
MNKLYFSLILIFGFFLNLNAQTKFKNIQLKKPELAVYPFSQVEPSIAIHPFNTDLMIAGSVLNDYYFSNDKGNSWTSTSITSEYGVFGDPVLMFDKNGFPYYFHLANYKNGAYIDRIVCQTSKSINGIWNEGSFPTPNGTKAQDKHWVSYSHKKDEIYLTWTQFDKYDSKKSTDSSIIFFSKSSDKSKTWSNPIRISKNAGDCLDSDKTVEGAVSTVGVNGEIIVVWANEKGLCLQKSFDDGITWLKEEKVIHELIGGWDLTVPGIKRCNGFPVLICDTSDSKNKGRIYLNWSDQRNGETNTDIFISYSDDLGDTWSEPKKVNQDSSKSHQFFTWMAIDQYNGNIYIVYYDRRNYTDNKTDVYLSVSKNGGISFEDIRISESPFIPNEKVFFGDYINISAVNGIVRPIWPRMDNDKISLWIALIDF